MINSILPAWVDADPLRSRATDALGLQLVADRLADRLLPGLSVLTNRARYFSFLCWARAATGSVHSESAIHRCEIALALTEMGLSDANPVHAESCRFVGSRNIQSFPKDRVPADPRVVYKTPAWRAYRPAMQAIRLLEDGPGFSLTDDGFAISKAFWKAVHPCFKPLRPLPRSACLSKISHEEKRRLRRMIGLSLSGASDPDSAEPLVRRAAFVREVRPIFRSERLTPEAVLPRYEARQSKTLREPARTLRVAAVWEWLSLGLNALFVAWVRAIEAGRRWPFEQDVRGVLIAHRSVPPLAPIALQGSDEKIEISKAIAALRHAIRLHDRIADCETMLDDEAGFEVARRLIRDRSKAAARVETMYGSLLSRHVAVKGDEAWVQSDHNGRLELARDAGNGWKVPSLVRLHPYRMASFDQIATDLGGF